MEGGWGGWVSEARGFRVERSGMVSEEGNILHEYLFRDLRTL